MSIITDYVDKVVDAITCVPEDKIRDAIDTLKAAHERGNQVFLIGNGGSAACATHIAEDLQKGLKETSGKRFKVMSLADSAPLIMAWANDSGYDCVFEQQIDSLLDPGDVVIAISGSGNSPNILKAVEKANAMGATTMGWSGMGGGQLAGLVDKPIVIESDNMQRIEDVHMVLGHLIFACMMQECGPCN